ncbi:glycosyl hydrolase 53 family protein [Mucilaginibacter sp. PAMB04274]|uniref:glycosyl hydrolase 53 family protein n=1 Tax=Mucilaginibacter sp. PAMB04274 TaxID=3138568 RepID=UPI0031F62255
MKKLFYVCILALTLLGACSKEKVSNTDLGTIPSDMNTGSSVTAKQTLAVSAEFAYGADISWWPQMEAKGYIWKNSSGIQKDLLDILKEKGINSVRLRTFVNPSTDSIKGHCSDGETVALALRCKKAGLRVMIDFHFGDSMNSVGEQVPPAAWANMTYAQMRTAMSTYVYHFMNLMKYYKVTADWIQIGNEENLGICGYVGSFAYNPVQMTGLLNIAYDQIKAVSPSTQVIVHLAQPQKLTAVENWFDTYKANGGKWDISGFSSYASSIDAPGIAPNFSTIQTRYGKPVMVVEVGGPTNKPSQTASTIKTYINYLRDTMPTGTGLGVFYWEPEVYTPFWYWENTAWDATTKMPTAAMNAFIH